MTVDLSKVVFYSGANAFKNDGTVYTGSLTFPTSLTSGQLGAVTTSFTLSSAPQFSKFFANFVETVDAMNSKPAQWYDEELCYSVGIYINSPSIYANWYAAFIYPIINGNTVTVRLEFQNPYGTSITLNPLTVPFAFVEYTLAN